MGEERSRLGAFDETMELHAGDDRWRGRKGAKRGRSGDCQFRARIDGDTSVCSAGAWKRAFAIAAGKFAERADGGQGAGDDRCGGAW